MAERLKRESSTEQKSDGTKAPKYLPRLLICEGHKDYHFFKLLIAAFRLPPFYIESAAGKDKIGATISRFKLQKTKIWANLRDVLIVGDNDDEPEERFQSICQQINEAFDGNVAPDAPQKPTKTKPRCTVLMVPWTDVDGNLECLCKEAARGGDKTAGEHVDAFLDLAHANLWESESRHGKAWLRANLAVRCKDPFVPLGDVFDDHRYRDLIPITKKDAAFKKIADALASVAG